MASGLGEFELIEALRERAARAGAPRRSSRLIVGSGDDAAVTAGQGGTVTSVDALVEGVHFERGIFTPAAIGRKGLATALSDLAAMGAEPGEAYVQLMLPDDLDSGGCLELADGLADVAGGNGVVIAGGDVSRASILALAITVVGYVAAPDQAVMRSGAAPGDVVVVTGELGGAAAGLEVLRNPSHRARLDPRVADRLLRRQLAPEPRLDAGRALAGAGASAMIDVSDGLGADTAHIATASGVAITIELSVLPVQAGVREVAALEGSDPLELAAARGEDYELVATLPASRIAEARSAVGETGLGLTEVGTVRDGSGVELIDPGGAVRQPAGYDQLAPRRGQDAPS